MKLTRTLAKISYLRATLHPEWFDGTPGAPGQVKISEPGIDLLLSEQVRGLARSLHNEGLREKLHGLGKAVAERAVDGLRAGFDGDEDICPPFHFGPGPGPGPHFGDWVALNPQPLPPGETAPGSLRDIVIAMALREIAALTTNAQFNREAQAIGGEIVRASAGRIFDDYCGTVVPPRTGPGR